MWVEDADALLLGPVADADAARIALRGHLAQVALHGSKAYQAGMEAIVEKADLVMLPQPVAHLASKLVDSRVDALRSYGVIKVECRLDAHDYPTS